MKIANIVSNTKLNVSEDFNVVESLDNAIQGLPTLLIGWDYVKEHFSHYDIINRTLSDNLYWTFKKTEKRVLHEEDIYNFVERVYKNLVKDINYVFIDPILFEKRKIKKILRKINSIKSVVSYKYDNMIYMYGENIIFGVDLSLLDFIGLSKDKIEKKIEKLSNIFLRNEDIFIEYKKRIENLDNQVKFIPYLYSIKNG